MIVWDDNLLYSPEVEKKLSRIRRRVEKRRLSSVFAYCVTFPTNEKNTLDIYNTAELIFRYYRDSDVELHIIGVSGSRAGAEELAAVILSEVYEKTGGFDVKSYYANPSDGISEE